MSMKEIERQDDYKADVVVIGGGGSGLPAAATAIEAGARKVIIIDKREFLGGSARMAGGLFAVESPAQKQSDIKITADECFKMHMEISNWMCDARLVRNWINETKNVLQWLKEKGVEIGKVMSFTGKTALYHQVVDKPSTTGNRIMESLIKFCEEKGVEVILNAGAQKLLTDEQGNVVGIIASQKGKELRIAAKSVIIASGSISGNKELVKRFYPQVDMDKVRIVGAFPWATGDGLRMTEEIGGAINGWTSTLWIGPHNHPYNDHVAMLMRRPEVLIMNKNGMRFLDESLFDTNDCGWFCGAALERQPNTLSYSLTDEKTKIYLINKRENICGIEDTHGRVAAKNQQGNIDKQTSKELKHDDPRAWWDELAGDIQFEAKEGRVKIADSLDEIAKWMGADPAVLKATVERYNSFCKNGYDADFLKAKEFLRPIDTPPFYAIQGREGADNCIGGIRINYRMEVMNKEFKPIGGLYAAGVATSGWLGHGYSFSGSCLSFSLYSGYAAGKIAAEHAKTITK